MARPTKKQIEDRSKIEAVLKRDIDYYTMLEERGEEITRKRGSSCFVPYVFIEACRLRKDKRTGIVLDIVIANETMPSIEYDFSVSYFALHMIDRGVFDSGSSSAIQYERKNYSRPILERNTPKGKRLEYSQLLRCRDGGYDKQLFLHAISLPIIRSNHNSLYGDKSALVQLDFTKPKEELLAIVSQIKADFDNDHTIIECFGEYLGTTFRTDPYMCNIKKCDIYKHKNPKPLEGRMADAFFIFDCKRLGLTKEYALDEINRYWNDVKKMHEDKIQDNTFKNYLKFAEKMIDEHELFQKGVSINIQSVIEMLDMSEMVDDLELESMFSDMLKASQQIECNIF